MGRKGAPGALEQRDLSAGHVRKDTAGVQRGERKSGGSGSQAFASGRVGGSAMRRERRRSESRGSGGKSKRAKKRGASGRSLIGSGRDGSSGARFEARSGRRGWKESRGRRWKGFIGRRRRRKLSDATKRRGWPARLSRRGWAQTCPRVPEGTRWGLDAATSSRVGAKDGWRAARGSLKF